MEDSKGLLNNSFIDFSIMDDIFNKSIRKDLIDIGRGGTITSSDGWEVELDPKTPIYTDVKCHIEPQTIDNYDIKNNPTKPIITTFKIFCNALVDVRNGDYITMKTCDVNGNILEIQTGIAGEPMQYLSGVEFIVGVSKFN